MNKGFDREVGTWNSLYKSPARGTGGRYAIFQNNAVKRTLKRMTLCQELLQPRPGMKILDIGCGSGAFCRGMVAKGAQWIGTDVSINMLRFGKDENADISADQCSWVNGSLISLPFRNAVFDAAACIGVLNFYGRHRIRSFLSEIARVVKPAGTVVLTSLRMDWLTWIRSRLYPRIPLPISSPGPLYPAHYKLVMKSISESGFECIEMVHVKKYLGLPHYTAFKLKRK